MSEIDPAATQTAIDGIRELTEALEQLRASRAEYRRAFGPARTRQAFAEIDAALRQVRKAAKAAM
jgi:hypothetical protein